MVLACAYLSLSALTRQIPPLMVELCGMPGQVSNVKKPKFDWLIESLVENPAGGGLVEIIAYTVGDCLGEAGLEGTASQ